VLTRFRSELTFWTGRGRGDAGDAFEASGDSFGRSPALEQSAEPRPAAGSSRTADIIDDDLPF
jgi:hypothetical protein